MGANAKQDRQDQPNQSVHAFRGTLEDLGLVVSKALIGG
jgi:hypothetical protein